MNLPLKLKVKNLAPNRRINENNQGNKRAEYLRQTNDGKYLLRKAMAKHVSSKVTDRDKQGFSSPDASWFRGESIDFVRQILLNPSAPIFSILNYKTVRKLLESHFAGKSNRRLLIWSLLYVNELLK